MHIPDWLINIAKDSETVQVKSSHLYKSETMNIINPRVEEQDLSKKVQPITVVVQGAKTDGNQSGKAMLLAYWSKSLEKIAEREVESADAVTMYDSFTEQVKNIDDKIRNNNYEEAATDSEKLLQELNPEVAEKDPLAPELNVEQLDPNTITEEEFLTSIDVGDIVQVSGSAKFQFKDSYLDSQYFRVTEDEFRTKLASTKPSLSYNTFNKAHMGSHNYIVSFYKDATLDTEVPVGDMVLIERDGTNQNWVVLGDGNDVQNAFYKVCRRLTIYPEDIGYAINPKGELVKSSSVSMVFFDTPEEAAKWQDLTQDEKDSKSKDKTKKDKAPSKETAPESTKPSSTEKLDEAMEELTEEAPAAEGAPAPAKDEKPFKSFKDYQEEKKEEAPAEGEEQTYSSSKCPKCGKPMKEDTDGDLNYCQGHSPFDEKQHSGQDPYSIPKSIDNDSNPIVYSGFRLGKFDKEAATNMEKAKVIMDLVDSTDLEGLATLANMILGTNPSFEDFEGDSGVAVAEQIAGEIEHMSSHDLDKIYTELQQNNLVASLKKEAGSLNKKLRELKKQMEDEKDPAKLDSMLSAIKKLKEHIADTKEEKEERKKEKAEKKEKAAEEAKSSVEELPKAATMVTNYGDVKAVSKVHFDETTSRYCVEWTNGDWRTDLDEPAVAEYLRNDHLTDEELAMVFDKVKKSETVEISRKESKDGESKLDVKKVKDLEEVKKALLAKGFTKEAATIDTMIKESFHMNECTQPGHNQVDSFLCQKCLKTKCSECSHPGTEEMGTVCAECIGK